VISGRLGATAIARLAIAPTLAYVVNITGSGQRAPVAERPVVLPPEYRNGERHMPQFPFSRLKETIRASAELRRECADAARRARAEFLQTRASTQKTVIESQELMAEADAIIAKR